MDIKRIRVILCFLDYLICCMLHKARGHAEDSENTVAERCLTKKEEMKGDEGVGF